jgi:hypothetical protein
MGENGRRRVGGRRFSALILIRCAGKGKAMKSLRSRWAAVSSVAAAGAAAVLVTGSLLAGPAAAASAPVHAAIASSGSSSVVVVNCANKDQVRPSSFVLTCADANDSLTGMHWQTWGSTAYGTGSTTINDCYPNCAQGKFFHFPTLAVLWRPEALPGHPGTQYFSRVSWVYSGAHCMPSPPKGQSKCLPLTGTFDLWSHL